MGTLWKVFAFASITVGTLCAQKSSPDALVNIPLGYWHAPERWLPTGSEASQGSHRARGGEASASAVGQGQTSNAAAGATLPLNFVAITPCRLMDTRVSSGFTGAFGPPALVSNTPRTVPIPASSCGVPASAAYSLNFTVIPSGPLGYLSAFPTTFQNTSILNSPTGQIIANGAVIPADSNGNIQVLASDPTDLVIDINGYYTPEAFNFLSSAVNTDLIRVGPLSGAGVNPGSSIHPGNSTSLTANFSFAPFTGCPSCTGQVVIGLVGQPNAQACLFSGQIGVTGTGTAVLTAPNAPGIYYIGVRDALQSGCGSAALNGGSYGAIIGSLTVY